jgi:hypothetical protein
MTVFMDRLARVYMPVPPPASKQMLVMRLLVRRADDRDYAAGRVGLRHATVS